MRITWGKPIIGAWLLLLFGVGAFGYLAHKMVNMELMYFDTFWIDTFRTVESERLTEIMRFITALGNTPTFISVTGVLVVIFILKRKLFLSLLITLNLLGSWWLNEVLKHFFKRERPGVEHLIYAGGFSFPSGHAMVSTACYGLLGYLLCHYLSNAKKKYVYAAFLFILLIVSIGISRVYLRVHYMSDVLAGITAGMVWLLIMVALHQKNIEKMR